MARLDRALSQVAVVDRWGGSLECVAGVSRQGGSLDALPPPPKVGGSRGSHSLGWGWSLGWVAASLRETAQRRV
jgi:hypothetical protein